jgi:hypothetical protein
MIGGGSRLERLIGAFRGVRSTSRADATRVQAGSWFAISAAPSLPKSKNRRYRTAIGDTVEPEPP